MATTPRIVLAFDDVFLRTALEDSLRRYLQITPSTGTADDADINDMVLTDRAPQDAAGSSHHIPVTGHPPVRLGHVLDHIAGLLRAKENHAPWHTNKPFSFGPWRFVPETLSLENVNGNGDARLTEKEAAILMRLHAENNRPVTRQDLLDAVWGYVADIETHTLETHIYRLRRKIESDPDKPALLVTDETGYRLDSTAFTRL